MAKQVKIQWTPSAGNTVAPTSQIVQRSATENGTYSTIHTAANNTTNEYIDTNVADGETWWYRVGAVFASGNTEYLVAESISISSASIILFEDDFAGVEDPMVSDADWNVRQNGVYSDLAKNNEAIMEVLAMGSVGQSYELNLTKVAGYDIATTKVMRFDILNSNQAVVGSIIAGFNSSSDPYTTVGHRFTIDIASATEIQARYGNGSAFDNTVITLDLSTYKSFKIVVDASNVSFYYHNGSAWVLIKTVTGHSESGTFYPSFGSRVYTGSVVGDIVKIDNVYVTDTDFSTLNPV